MNPQQRRRKQIEDGLTDAELEAEDDREADRYMRDLEARLNFTENKMTEQQMRKTLQDNDIEEDEIEAQIDRWADDKTRMREEMEYMERTENE